MPNLNLVYALLTLLAMFTVNVFDYTVLIKQLFYIAEHDLRILFNLIKIYWRILAVIEEKKN